MWKCKKCVRQFQTEIKFHSCIKMNVSKHFEGKKELFDLYKILVKKINKISKITEDPVKSVIILCWRAKFSSVKVMSDRLRVGIILPRKIRSKRMIKIWQNGNSYYHTFDIFSTKDIDSTLIGWYEEADALGK